MSRAKHNYNVDEGDDVDEAEDVHEDDVDEDEDEPPPHMMIVDLPC